MKDKIIFVLQSLLLGLLYIPIIYISINLLQGIVFFIIDFVLKIHLTHTELVFFAKAFNIIFYVIIITSSFVCSLFIAGIVNKKHNVSPSIISSIIIIPLILYYLANKNQSIWSIFIIALLMIIAIIAGKVIANKKGQSHWKNILKSILNKVIIIAIGMSIYYAVFSTIPLLLSFLGINPFVTIYSSSYNDNMINNELWRSFDVAIAIIICILNIITCIILAFFIKKNYICTTFFTILFALLLSRSCFKGMEANLLIIIINSSIFIVISTTLFFLKKHTNFFKKKRPIHHHQIINPKNKNILLTINLIIRCVLSAFITKEIVALLCISQMAPLFMIYFIAIFISTLFLLLKNPIIFNRFFILFLFSLTSFMFIEAEFMMIQKVNINTFTLDILISIILAEFCAWMTAKHIMKPIKININNNENITECSSVD